MSTDFLFQDLPNHTIFVRHALLDTVQCFFTDAKIKGLIFDQDPESTDILILDELTENAEPVAFRPRIVFHFGGLQAYDASIGHLMAFDPLTSLQKAGKVLVGQSSFTCESRNGMTASLMASMLFNMFVANYRQMLNRGFMWCAPLSISSERVIDADADTRRTAVDVTIKHAHSIVMNIYSESPPLSAISTTADVVREGEYIAPELSMEYSVRPPGGKITNITYPFSAPVSGGP